MAGIIAALPYAVAGGFFLLGAVAAGRWLRRRDALSRDLAIAVGLLGAAALVERLHALSGFRHRSLEDLSIVTFLGSGFALLMVRHRILPLTRRVRLAIAAAVILLGAVAAAMRLPMTPQAALSPLQEAVTFSLIVAWGACTLEPVLRLWRGATRRPAVQRARLRAVSLGYGGILAVLTVAFLADPSSGDPAFVASVNLVALGMLPVLYAAFVPPAWLRRLWRTGEEEAMGRAMADLLAGPPEVATLAGEVVGWAERLVGGDAALLWSASRGVLAARGLGADAARAIAERAGDRREAAMERLGGQGFAIVLPVRSPSDAGALVVVAGPLTPLFGPEEVSELGRFASSAWSLLEQARLVERLREETSHSEALLGAFSDLGEGVVVVEGYRVVYANEAYETLTGYTLEELRALESLMELTAPDQVEAIGERGRRRREGIATESHYETALIRKDGRRVDVEVSIKELHRDGSRQYVSVVRDVSVRKRSTEALRAAYHREREAARRLRAVDEMKDAFLMAVSHELRTPLTSIVGFAETLRAIGSELEPDARTDLASRLSRNARKLERLLTDLLDLDRLRRNVLKPRTRATDLGALVRRMLGEVDLLGRSGIVDLEPVEAEVDAPKVERIVENLLTNAVRYTPPGSRLWVSVRRRGADALLSVEDEGPGVPAELRERIFDPFRQGPDAVKHSPGVGIGLSLVGRFAELHGGRAWVEERPGGGSSFRVTLPLSASRGRPRLPGSVASG